MACDCCMGINSDQCPVCGHQTPREECPECKGVGKIYVAYDILKDNEVEVTKIAYELLPQNEVMAEAMGKRYCQGYIEKCQNCCGYGYVEADENDIKDDYDEYEHYYKRKYAANFCSRV